MGLHDLSGGGVENSPQVRDHVIRGQLKNTLDFFSWAKPVGVQVDRGLNYKITSFQIITNFENVHKIFASKKQFS